jgi:hypothetical protein
MATRSTIAIVDENNEGRQIYCHWDGYLEGNGTTLMKHYTTIEKINKLMDLGDLSSLGENIDPPQGKEHSFDSKVDGVCVAYGRDRGEKDIEAKKFRNEPTRSEEFDYLFKNGKWHFRNLGREFVEISF